MPEKSPTALSGEGHPPYEDEFRGIGEILDRDAEAIIERWYQQANEEQGPATDESRSDKVRAEMMDELLTMLQSLGQRLQKQSSDALKHATKLARQHGQQRSQIGWDVGDLVRDYEILHGVVLEHLGQTWNERLTYRQAVVLSAVFDRAIGSAVEAFVQKAGQQERQVQRQQDELRQLTLDLIDAEHRQRQQFALILHDDFQQILWAVQMKLGLALQDGEPTRPLLEEANDLLTRMLEISRDLTADMHPVVLEYRGLPAAIEWLAETFHKRYGLTVEVELQVTGNSKQWPMSLRRLVFDAIRELLFNVVKHAKTDEARVSICCDDRSPWSIVIEDQGVGSTEMKKPDAVTDHPHFGLENIRYRLEQIGGTMQVHSQPGEGTRVELTVPLASPLSP